MLLNSLYYLQMAANLSSILAQKEMVGTLRREEITLYITCCRFVQRELAALEDQIAKARREKEDLEVEEELKKEKGKGRETNEFNLES